MKNIFAIFIAAALLAGCGQGGQKMQIVVDTATQTFDFMDVSTGSKITSYGETMLEGKKVIDTHVTTGFVEGVAFAVNEGQIVRTREDVVKEGIPMIKNSVTLKNIRTFTIHAVFQYKLENGVLSITPIE